MNNLSAMQSREAARRMEDIMRHHTLFADVLYEEKWNTQIFYIELFRNSRWREDIKRLTMCENLQSFNTSVLAYTISKKKMMGEITSFFNIAVANARLPYALRKFPPLPKDPFTAPVLSIFPKAAIKDAYCETQNCLLLVSLALRAFYLEHEHYPVYLSELIPSYLTQLPDDLFAVSGTLRYRRTVKSYLLYSVGPDGKDDHGNPCAGGRETKIGEPFQEINSKSTGDIVAGVNVR